MSDPNNVHCNAVHHQWIDTDWTGAPPMWGFPDEQVCEGCGKRRRDIYDRLGNVASRRYIPPPGYHKYGAGTRPSKADFRLEMVKAKGTPFGRKGLRAVKAG